VATGLVVGIYPESDPKALESALSAAQVDLSKVKVVGGAPDDTESSELEFVDVMDEVEASYADELTKGMGILSDSGGTSVPGISGGRQASLDSFTRHEDPSKRYLAAFAIPPDEVDNFYDAIAEGRSVVLYLDAGDDEQKIAEAFKAAGLRNVRAY
jgi:rhodanese-related sulfurtransferase